MKIAFVDLIVDPAKPGASGLSDIVWNMAAQLAKVGDEVHVVGPYTTDKYPHPGVQVHRFGLPPIGYRNILGHLLIVLRIWLELRRIRGLDVIHAPEYFSTGVLTLLIRDTPIVLTVPGNIYERIKNGNPFDPVTTVAYKITARLSAKLCAAVVATSEEMTRWWEYTGASPSRIKLVPYGVNTEIFMPVPDARKKLGIDANSKLILYAGRFSPEKGLECLIQAFACLSSRDHVQLLLVGNGPAKSQLVEKAHGLGLRDAVVFSDWIPKHELPYYYSSSDVYVLPSFSEGMPRVMVEAMACGAPFLGTAITGIVDHVADGQTGFLVPPGDAEALADKLHWILENPQVAKAVGLRGCEYVRNNLDWAVITRRVREEVYIPLVEGKPA